MGKKRIAIVGAGPAGLATAFELTSTPGWDTRFDIDLYSMGWRLGGKCASSRNRKERWRNEEHGFHILGGFYHNAFDVFRRLYDAWPKVSSHAIAFDDAFFGQDEFAVMQPGGTQWSPASIRFESNTIPLGTKPDRACIGTMLHRLTAWLAGQVEQIAQEHLLLVQNARSEAPSQETDERVARHRAGHAEFSALAALLSRHASEPHKMLTENFDEGHHEQLGHAARTLQSAAHHAHDGTHQSWLRHVDWVALMEVLATVVRGFITDRLTLRGFDSINDEEMSGWLKRHGASERALNCSLFRGAYHYAFAFADGDPQRPDMPAGVAIRTLMRMAFTYHQSLFVHMNGGMGEIVATPFFEVLKSRGVNIHFFHRLEEIVPANGALKGLRMRVQARTKSGAPYDPLVVYQPPNGQAPRMVWPEAPLYEQLEDADALSGVDLESWHDSEGVGEEKLLEAGRDFDLAVVATPIGTLRYTSRALSEANAKWDAMLRAASTTPTIAAQIWRRESRDALKGITGEEMMTGYALPHSTLADMSFLLELEQPAGDERPASLFYFCGPAMAEGSSHPKTAVAEAREFAKRATDDWLTQFTRGVFPGICDSSLSYRNDGELGRMTRLNSDPASLYVATLTGSVKHRLRADESGFANLFLTGDWIRTNFDAGSVEAAIMSAKFCARAVDGIPREIYSESDFK